MNETKQNGTDLTGRKRKLIEALLTTPSVQAACDAAGVARSTAFAWLRDEGFRNELNRAQRATFDASMSRIASMSAEAVNRLSRLIVSDNESIALGAVRLVIGSGASHLDAQELAAKLSEIEGRMEAARA